MSDPRSSIVDAMARRKLALDDEARGNYEAMQPPAAPAPQSGWERDDVLPFARRVENGQRQPGWSLAAPKFLADAVETAGRVGSSPLFGPQRIGQEPREEMVNAAGAVVGPMAGVGIGRAAAMAPKGGGELGIFGGRMAKTADHAALARAEQLAAEGAPRDRIWNDTGWFKGPDNQWRFEIDDSRMPPPLPDPSGGKMRPADVTANGVDGKGAAIRHQALAEAYPQLNDLSVSVGRGSIGGEFSGGGGVGALGVTAPTTGVARGGLLHELQHAVQQQEGFASGGTPGQFQQYKGWSPFSMLRDDAQAFNKYNRLAGEVESRATQKRADLTAEQRRARPPWLDYDVPEAQQIVRMGNSGPQMSMDRPTAAVAALPMDFESRMARAKEMGFRLNPVYHGTATQGGEIFSAFDPARVGGRTSGSQAGQQGVSVALSPAVANEFAQLAAEKSGGNPAVMPLLHRTERPASMRLDGTEKNLEVAATLSDAFANGHDAVALRNYTTPSGSGGNTAVILRDPSQLRSINAAFDPARRHEADLLASRFALLPLTQWREE